ncbi:MAG: acyl-CoA dehydrogenase family protein [Flavobacteriales bacterium]|nr:acyl-CoA dehydrogenase family protein [Bacteroidota bacterium]MCB9240040.1 acyl-CoA dehydrogenase family protein [Flavobacteriales bacterium]
MKGGEFLITRQDPSDVFIPEELNEEQLMFRNMTLEFMKSKIYPFIPQIDKQKEHPEMVPNLLNEAGELGLLGAGVPEEYGGMGVDFNTETVLGEELGKSQSFGVAVAAHTGIGTLPILYFGTEEQKKKYLPDLASGKRKASYCLTEPNSGSDALAARTKAVLDGDEWVLNGQKMWITNAGFADLFIVFAKVDGEQFSCFIVEKGTPGLSLGDEEIKLGIKGSSTRQVFFENVRIPKDNLLGEIGKGHKIAFNVLNIGRFKLCAMVMGGSKKTIDVATNYANERHQFGVSISSFGAIQHKLAEMAIRTFATESATYRVSDLIADKITELVDAGATRAEAKLKAAEEYNIECAILKVLGSESLDFVVDEAVQIFGGTGYSEEYPVARIYRDSRINRIFEGTNEINRMLAVGQMMKKALKGELDLMTPAMKITEELMSIPDFGDEDEGLFAAEYKAIDNAKKAILMAAGAAAQKYMMELENQQEILMNLADMAIDTFTAESAILRTHKLVNQKGEEAAQLQIKMCQVYLNDALERINSAGKRAVCGFAEGDELRMMLLGIKRFTKYEPLNTIALRKEVAAKMIETNAYPF